MNRMNYRTIFIFFIFSLLSCKNSSNTELQRNEETIKDLNSLGIIPKESFEYNSLVKAKDDTLEIVTCAKYVIRPFGGMNSEEELKRSLLSNFKIISQQKKDSLYFYYTIELNENRLNLFLKMTTWIVTIRI